MKIWNQFTFTFVLVAVATIVPFKTTQGAEPTTGHWEFYSYQGAPRANIMSTSRGFIKCFSALGLSHTTPPFLISKRGVSSRSQMQDGSLNDQQRGILAQEIDINKFDSVTMPLVSRILQDWRSSQTFTEEQLMAIFNLHQRLMPIRTKLLSYEGEGERLAAVRIYDSSKKPKYYSRHFKLPRDAEGAKPVIEMVFPGFDLTKALADSGNKRADYTWSLGLLDISGPQQNGIKTLLSSIASFLDLHYNHREFFNLESLSHIESQEVDIEVYANVKLENYYSRNFVPPLKNSDGTNLVLEKGGESYHVYVIKGSQFIKKFLDINYSEPLYGSQDKVKSFPKFRSTMIVPIRMIYRELDPKNYQIRNQNELHQKINFMAERLAKILQLMKVPNNLIPQEAKERELLKWIAEVLMYRRYLPDDIFDGDAAESDNLFSETNNKENSIESTMGQVFVHMIAQALFEDPLMFYYHNSTAKSDM